MTFDKRRITLHIPSTNDVKHFGVRPLAEGSTGTNPSTIRRDVTVALIVAGGFLGLYAFFKFVSILAGLPFP